MAYFQHHQILIPAKVIKVVPDRANVAIAIIIINIILKEKIEENPNKLGVNYSQLS